MQTYSTGYSTLLEPNAQLGAFLRSLLDSSTPQSSPNPLVSAPQLTQSAACSLEVNKLVPLTNQCQTLQPSNLIPPCLPPTLFPQLFPSPPSDQTDEVLVLDESTITEQLAELLMQATSGDIIPATPPSTGCDVCFPNLQDDAATLSDFAINGSIALLQLQRLVLQQQDEQYKQDLEQEVILLKQQALQLQQQVLQQQEELHILQQQQEHAVTSPRELVLQPSSVPGAVCHGLTAADQQLHAFASAAGTVAVEELCSGPACNSSYSAPLLRVPSSVTPACVQVPQACDRPTSQRRFSMLHFPCPSMWDAEQARACQAVSFQPWQPRSSSMVQVQAAAMLPSFLESPSAAEGLGMAASRDRVLPSTPSNIGSSSCRSSMSVEPACMAQVIQSSLYQQAQVPRGAAASRQVLCSRRYSSSHSTPRVHRSPDAVNGGGSNAAADRPFYSQPALQQPQPCRSMDAVGNRRQEQHFRCASLDLPRHREAGAGAHVPGLCMSDVQRNTTIDVSERLGFGRDAKTGLRALHCTDTPSKPMVSYASLHVCCGLS